MNLPKPSAQYPELAIWTMDATHAKAFQLIDNINQSNNEDFPLMVEIFVDHTKEHFEQERLVMVKTDFPAYREHETEHARILGDIIQFQSALKRGRVNFVRQFFKNALPEILENHIRQVDSALAAHIKKVNGSKPTAL